MDQFDTVLALSQGGKKLTLQSIYTWQEFPVEDVTKIFRLKKGFGDKNLRKNLCCTCKWILNSLWTKVECTKKWATTCKNTIKTGAGKKSSIQSLRKWENCNLGLTKTKKQRIVCWKSCGFLAPKTELIKPPVINAYRYLKNTMSARCPFPKDEKYSSKIIRDYFWPQKKVTNNKSCDHCFSRGIKDLQTYYISPILCFLSSPRP